MWKEFKIEEQIYFYECKIVKETATCMLYDLKRIWCESIELAKLMDRVNELNKRIQFNKFVIEDTLVSEDAVDAHLAGDEALERTLQLKYRIDKHPFHFKWLLKEQAEKEFREAIMLPLFMVVRGMRQQIEELRGVIAKKDKELRQYKEEGAVLRITTVATKPFDFAEFDEKFAVVNKVSKNFQQLSENIAAQQVRNESKIEEAVKNTEQVSETGLQQSSASAAAAAAAAAASSAEIVSAKSSASSKIKYSPRSRKRKNWEIQHQHMVAKLQARKRKLEYECSQSQSLPEAQHPPFNEIEEELADLNRSLRSLEKQRL